MLIALSDPTLNCTELPPRESFEMLGCLATAAAVEDDDEEEDDDDDNDEALASCAEDAAEGELSFFSMCESD